MQMKIKKPAAYILPDRRPWKVRHRVDIRKREGRQREDFRKRNRDRKGYKRPDAGKRPKTHRGATGSSRKSGGNKQSSTGLDAAFAFDEECRPNGTGGRKAVHLPKPKDTVPKEQLALEKAMKHALEEDGNKTRVQLEKLVVKTEVKEEMDQGKRPNYHSGGHKPRWLDEQTEIPEEEYRSYRTKRPGRSQNDYRVFLPHCSPNCKMTTTFGDLCDLLCWYLRRAPIVGERRRSEVAYFNYIEEARNRGRAASSASSRLGQAL